MRNGIKYPLCIASLLFILCAVAACGNRFGAPNLSSKAMAARPAASAASKSINANVLLYWPTDENDPVYKQWSEIARKELRRQGIRGAVEVYFAHATERYESSERHMLNEALLRLRSEGRKPDLILSYGDANAWLLTTNTSSIALSIPAVCYGLSFDEYLPYQYELLSDNYNGGRWDMVRIRAPFHLKENLVFADSISAKIGSQLQLSDYPNIVPHRLITMLDVENLWSDRIRFNELDRQMQMLDEAYFYSNLNPTVVESTLRHIARDLKKIVFSCRSIMNPVWNLGTTPFQHSTTWAFYPQKSSNFYLQSKHDNKSLNMINGPSFLPFFTMIAQDFNVSEKCIGGYFPLFQDQIRDAVSAGRRLLQGETAEDIGALEHSPGYYLNWDVLRPFGFDVNLIPERVTIFNATFKDRNPKMYRTVNQFLFLLFVVVLICSMTLIAIFSLRAHRNVKRINAYINETLDNNRTLNNLMAVTDFKIWEKSNSDKPQLDRISTTPFFLDKLKDFVGINKSGTYTMQVYGAIDNQPAHWYEIRMTVSVNSDLSVNRRGVIINNDKQKKMEAMEAEANRLITSAKAREGFLASMNHEIRTPLNSIVGYSQLLSMPGIVLGQGELGEYTKAITDNIDLLQSTLDNIITTGKISRSEVKAEVEDISLSGFIGPGCTVDPGKKFRTSDRIQYETSPEPVFVMADRKMLQTVIFNLVENALRFSDPASSVTIGWRACKDREYRAELYVKDCGIGINRKFHELVFESFFKVDSFSPGCGLGLFICKSYVEMMNGSISLRSKEGKGSEFIIKMI